MHTRLSSFLPLAALLAATLGGCALATDESPTGSGNASLSGRPYFEVFQGTGDDYYFHFAAGNHELVLASEGYSSRVGALNGVLSVLDNGGLEGRYDVLESKSGQYYFNLRARNGQIIGTSELYVSRSNAKAGVQATVAATADYLEYWSHPTGDRFEIFAGKDGRFYFRLKASNGEAMLQSQGYSSEAAAYNGAFSVADNGLDSARYQVHKAQNGGYYFNLVASNGEIIGTSEVYSTRSNALRGRDDTVALLQDVEIL